LKSNRACCQSVQESSMSSTDSDIDIDKTLLLQATGVGLGALSAAGLVCVMCSPHKATGVALRRGPLGVGGISATLACLSGGLGIGGGYSDSTWEFWGTVTSLTSSAVSLAAYIILTKCLTPNPSDTTDPEPKSGGGSSEGALFQFFGNHTLNNHGVYESNTWIEKSPPKSSKEPPSGPLEQEPAALTSSFKAFRNLFRTSPTPKDTEPSPSELCPTPKKTVTGQQTNLKNRTPSKNRSDAKLSSEIVNGQHGKFQPVLSLSVRISEPWPDRGGVPV